MAVFPVLPDISFPNTFMPFTMFCQKVLPAVYDDSLSYYELLCKVVDSLNKNLEASNDLNEDVQKLYDYLKQLQEYMEYFLGEGFDGDLDSLIERYVNEHMDEIFETYVRQVYFGINQNGYFTAYIPSSWNDIVFDTGAVYSLDTYGRLILRWDADSPETVDQTPETVR